MMISDQSVMDNIPAPRRKYQKRLFMLGSDIKNYTEKSILRFNCGASPGLLQYSDFFEVCKTIVESKESSFAEIEGHCRLLRANKSVDKPGEGVEKQNSLMLDLKITQYLRRA